jgi:hypothetical protein
MAIAGLAFGVSCATVEPLDGSVLLGIDSGMPHPPAAGGATGAGGFVAMPDGMGGFQAPPAAGGMMMLGRGGRMMRGSGGAAAGAPGNPTAGAPGASGRTGAGGAARGMGGMMGTSSGGSGPPSCAANEKVCGGVCAAPSPKVGCGMTDCNPCTMTAPMNGYLTCTNGMCGFDCLSGYMKNGDKCDGPPPGSAGGCPSSPVGCPDCGLFGPGCCAMDKCGCSPIPWTIGVLGCI